MAEGADEFLSDAVPTIENNLTVDTLNSDEIRSFVNSAQSIKLGDGRSLWALVLRLPVGASSMALGWTKTRIIKYLTAHALWPASLTGEHDINKGAYLTEYFYRENSI